MTNIYDLTPESHHDLLEAVWAGALATLDAEGRPQTTAVWYLADREDGQLKISLAEARQKFKHIAANPEVGFLLIDPQNQFRTIEVRGSVTFEIDADGALATKVGAKYDADLASFDEPGEARYAVTVVPRRVIAR